MTLFRPMLVFGGVLWLVLVVASLCGEAGAVEPDFPTLVGRVVDGAGVIGDADERHLSSVLGEHEEKTSNQVVVVTLKHLQGYPIEDFGYQLGRYWGIGQEGKDNGVLLIVALKERKIRIEVGYGLEGVLTDSRAKSIIDGRISPALKQGEYGRGLLEGVQNIIKILEGESPTKTDGSQGKKKDYSPLPLILALVGLPIVIFIVLAELNVFAGGRFFGKGTDHRGGRYSNGGYGGGGYGGGGFRGGGFGGGGGGFGGGGASGGF